MAFKKGDKKPVSSGRKKGSKNLKTVLRAEAVMADADFNPISLLIDLAKDEKTPTDQRVKIAIELSSLINAKPKAKEEEPPEEPPTGLESVPTGDLLTFTQKPK